MSQYKVDVLICGGGPVGLLIAYCLARYGVTTYVAEQHDKVTQTMYGRAAMIAPRTLEMLDQLDLADALGQIGFVTRGQKSYKEGKMVDALSAPTSGITDTFFDYCLLCRQRYTEDTIAGAYASISENAVHYGAKVVNMDVAESPTLSAYGVTTKVELSDVTSTTIKSKFIIGADGGSSTIRSLANIPFPGERNSRYWVRIDGHVRTNMPYARFGNVGLDSATHGSILWACLDHGITRVGFALPPPIWDQYGHGITQEVVIAQAQEALRPFLLEFDSVDWWTVYAVGQRLASTYRAKDRIFLAGDAAHTHSSAGAQGMNTGLHDAVNLAWKLGGVINGCFTADILETYEWERRPIGEKIVEQDRLFSNLTGGEIPDALKDQGDDAATLLTDVYRKNTRLNTGLGIDYPCDGLINVASSVKIAVGAGTRAPDVLLQRPGPRLPIRLFSLIKNDAIRFNILVFCGSSEHTAPKLKTLRKYLGSDESFARHYSPALFRFITILATGNDNGAAEESLGCPGFGTVVYDTDGSAHERYGVLSTEGAVVVLRPDGTVGTAVGLGDGEVLGRYFEGFLLEKSGDGGGWGAGVDGEVRGKKGGRGDEKGRGVEGVTNGEIKVEN